MRCVFIWFQELTSNKPCEKSLLIDYTTYHKSFEMTMVNDQGMAYRTVFQALKDSADNGWTTPANDNRLFTMIFSLKDKCSEKGEINTISFRTSSAKEVELQIGKIMKYPWVRNSKVYIISCALVVVIVYSECQSHSQQLIAHSLMSVAPRERLSLKTPRAKL